MLSVNDLLSRLRKDRPLFHSEADFQHALAWQLHLQHPTSQIWLERSLASPLGRLHIDICCTIADEAYIFELKYKTRAASLTVAGEEFYLQNHSAYPPSRYDFVKDIARLEAVVRNSEREICGFAIFLTNDRAYWSDPRKIDGVSSAFSIHEGQRILGELDWGPAASAGTKKNREKTIKLEGQYVLSWQDYSNSDIRTQTHFRYLCVPVLPPRQ